jgi:hypothetical protein
VREQKANCLAFVKMRKPQQYFSSKKNSEEWPANFSSDGEKRFVGESWFAANFPSRFE